MSKGPAASEPSGETWRLRVEAVLAEECAAIWGALPGSDRPEIQAAEAEFRAASSEAAGPGSEGSQQAQERLERARAELAKLSREVEYRTFVHGKEQAALCLSGGGIRSAAFALGVLQGLARKGLLTQFHYLSTVSGGGYIGAWLTRWMREEGSAVVQAKLAQSVPPQDAPEVKKCAPPRFHEPEQIRRLRERTNFLTPKVGLTSTDTWTAAAIVLRNLLLNWLLFLPALLLLTLSFNLYRDVFGVISAMPGLAGWWWTPVVLFVLAAPLAFAVTRACLDLPTHARDSARGYATSATIRREIVGPALAWSFLLPLALAPSLPGPQQALGSVALAAGMAFASAMVGYLIAWRRVGQAHQPHFARNLLVWVTASVVAAAVLGAGVWLAERLLDPSSPALGGPVRTAIVVALGPLWITIAHLLTSVIYAGFRRRVPADWTLRGASVGGAPCSLPTPDLDREWLARLSAAKLQLPVAWALVGLACLALPPLVWDYGDATWKSLTSAATAVTGVFAAFGGKSALSGLTGRADGTARRRWPSFNSLVGVATAVFMAALLMLLARLEDSMAHAVGAWLALPTSSPLAHTPVLIGLLAILLLASAKLKVNRFSLHGLYRNRLVRAFLGAARAGSSSSGDRDPFTDFDPYDNMRVAELAASGPHDGQSAPRALFPVINLALNITGGDRLAWQERKAMSFTVTPLACGWTDPTPMSDGQSQGAYAPTAKYGGNERDAGMSGDGISLGTAITVSGAAASPNMGYNSSPATAFLMTLFNVRLGAWLPNPAAERCSAADMARSSPGNALIPLFSELAGWSDSTSRYVYLSDGGHFDNLGLYEMVRRRCRLIFVSDAGCDPQCRFEDLGMAIRKIWIDFQVRITLDKVGIVPRGRAQAGDVSYATGTIVYPEADAPPGHLIYLKPSYLAWAAPIDVRSYAEANEDFPHESTADQWFSESQFESYRRLGEAAVIELGGTSYAGKGALSRFFDAVKDGPRPKNGKPSAAAAHVMGDQDRPHGELNQGADLVKMEDPVVPPAPVHSPAS